MRMNWTMKDEVRPSPMEDKKYPPWITSLLLFALFLITLAVYYPSLRGDFLNIDDQYYIGENEFIHDLSLKGVYKIFTSIIVANYFPLQILSYAIDYHLWGLNPFGYRLGNLIFHLGNAFLVFFLLRHLLAGRTWLSFAGSLIFSLHPVNVESVAWVSERKNVLSVFFLLLSFLAYFRYLEGERKGLAYGFSLGLYLLSILAKVSSVIFPLLLILYDLCFTNRSRREWIKDKIPFFLLSAFFSGLAVYIYHLQKIIPEYHGGHPINNFLTMTNVIVEYILSLFVPLYLNFYYDTRLVKSLGEYQFLLSFSFLLLVAVLATRWYRKEQPLFFSLFWFFLPLLPVLNIVPIAILRADRYLYLSSVGFAYFLAWGIPRVLGDTGKKVSWSALGVLFLIAGVFGWLTEQQAGYWRSPFHLWSRVMKYIPSEAKAYCFLGNNARDKGQVILAETLYREALDRAPRSPAALNNLGILYLNKGRVEEAHALFQRALESDPDYPDAQINLGISYWKKGEEEQAIAAFKKAKGNKKNRATANNNLGVIYQNRGDYSRALALFREAVREGPQDMGAWMNFALALEKNGQMDEAIVQLEKAHLRHPLGYPINYQLGRLYLKKSNPSRAAEYFSEALRVKPEDPDVHFQLAKALNLIPGQEERSQFHLEKALREQRQDDPRTRFLPKRTEAGIRPGREDRTNHQPLESGGRVSP
jgi:tetratricopeptide (TPR) repeat protein